MKTKNGALTSAVLIEDSIDQFVIKNDLQFFLENVTLPKAAKMARESRIPGSLKDLKTLIKTSRIDNCVYWGQRIKPKARMTIMPDGYWEKLREAVRRYEAVLADLYPLHAEMVLRLAVSTNIQLMRGLTKRYQVWKG